MKQRVSESAPSNDWFRGKDKPTKGQTWETQGVARKSWKEGHHGITETNIIKARWITISDWKRSLIKIKLSGMGRK